MRGGRTQCRASCVSVPAFTSRCTTAGLALSPLDSRRLALRRLSRMLRGSERRRRSDRIVHTACSEPRLLNGRHRERTLRVFAFSFVVARRPGRVWASGPLVSSRITRVVSQDCEHLVVPRLSFGLARVYVRAIRCRGLGECRRGCCPCLSFWPGRPDGRSSRVDCGWSFQRGPLRGPWLRLLGYRTC